MTKKSSRRSIYDPTMVSAALDAANEEGSRNWADPYGLFVGGGDGVEPWIDDDQYEMQRTSEIRRHAQDLLREETRGARRAGRFKALGAALFVAVGAAGIVASVVVVVTTRKSSPTSLHRLPSDFEATCTEPVQLEWRQEYECGKICDAAACCDFPPEDEWSCLAGNEDACMEYHRKCQKLQPNLDEFADGWGDDVTIPLAPSDLAERCSYDKISTSERDLTKCQKMCEPSSCCYEKPSGDVASCVEHATCQSYSPCYNLRVYDSAWKQAMDEEIEQDLDSQGDDGGISDDDFDVDEFSDEYDNGEDFGVDPAPNDDVALIDEVVAELPPDYAGEDDDDDQDEDDGDGGRH